MLMLYHFIKISAALVLALLIYFVGLQGCSPTTFAPVGNLSCEEFPAGSNCKTQLVEFSCEERPTQAKCQRTPRSEPTNPRENSPDRERERKPSPPPQHFCKSEYDLSLGQVDILFVIDNSSSMAQEHRNLADQFNSFLYDIKDVNYHLAVITTDISSSPNNPNRNKYFQDGRFIPIGDRKFLRNENLGDRPSKWALEAFKTAIERKETKDCDRGKQPAESGDKYDRLYDRKNQEAIGCPSSDERGTYAVKLAIENPSYRSFFRPEAHLMVIFLSDEDVRSGEEYYNQEGLEYYQPLWEDEPETLIDRMYEIFPKSKTYSFYSIIIPPGDERCLEEQNRYRADGPGSGRGYYGREYARLSKAGKLREHGNILRGEVISICSRNYSYQLRKVAVSAQVSRVPLFCPNPEEIDLYVNGSKVRSDQEIEGRTLLVQPKGDIPLSSRITVKTLCLLAPGEKCK